MSDVEIIYINRNKDSIENLNPQVDIHKKDFKRKNSLKDKKIINQKVIKKTKTRRTPMFYISVFIAFMVFTTALISSYNAGYVPIDAFLEIKTPSGVTKEISYSDIKENYPVVDSIPEIKNIKHKIFESDEEISVIADNYGRELREEGYNLKYSGVRGVKGVDVHYYAYVKGLTAAVILITDDNIDLYESKTKVLYSSGSVFSYRNIMSKYAGNFDF